MVQHICKIHQKFLILGTSKTVRAHGRQTQGGKSSHGQGPQQRVTDWDLWSAQGCGYQEIVWSWFWYIEYGITQWL